MRDLTRRAGFGVLIAISTATSGCGGGPQFASAAATRNAAGPTVDEPERLIVQDAARHMIGSREALVHGLSARISAGEEGLDVCGYVDTPSDSGLPLYVELREADGAVRAQRGQVGATPQKLAKVRFMCRRH
jgi:hypothetical protein